MKKTHTIPNWIIQKQAKAAAMRRANIRKGLTWEGRPRLIAKPGTIIKKLKKLKRGQSLPAPDRSGGNVLRVVAARLGIKVYGKGGRIYRK